MHWLRLLKIVFVTLRFGLDEFVLGHTRLRWLQRPVNILLFWRNTSPRAASACAWHWNHWDRSSSSSARCSPPGAI